MSSYNTPSFADLLIMVPDLLLHYVRPEMLSDFDDITLLRLVSKEVGPIIMRAQTSCELKPGKSPSFSAEKIAALMQHTKLESLKVTIDCTAGSNDSTSTSNIMNKCVQDINSLVLGASSAIRPVTHLTLTVRHSEPTSTYGYLSYASLSSSGKGIHYQVPRKAFALLAASLPHLQKLTTNTQYGDVDFAAFTFQCPALTELRMDCDPLALQGIDLALPNLSILHISKDFTSHVAKEYVEQACMFLRGCSNLTNVTIYLQGYIPSIHNQLDCTKDVWEQLPQSLVEWHTNASFTYMHEATSFLSNIRVLTIGQLPEDCESLPELLKLSPHLKELSIWQPVEPNEQPIELMWGSTATAAELLLLKERLCNGFKLSCQGVNLSGTSKSISDMLTWLLPLQRTQDVRIYLDDMIDESALDCIGLLAQACPAINYLMLGCDLDWENTPPLRELTLAHLMGNTRIMRADIFMEIAFTHAGLVRLCTSMPALHTLYYQPCEGLLCKDVMADLAAHGHRMTVAEIVHGESLPHVYGL